MASRLKNKLGIFTVIGSLAIGMIGGYEGLRTKAYPDRFAGGLPTVCFGETRGVKLGDEYTVDECKAMLGDAIVDFEKGIRSCLTNPDAIPPKVYVTSLSLAYNIGKGAFCGSTIRKHLNKGDYRAACNGFPAWNKAGGRVNKGLVNRRASERKICLQDVK